MKKSIFLLFAVMLTMLSANAATHTVTQITDDGTGTTTGSLSWAINAAADGDTIVFNLSSGDVITLSAALPAIDNTLTMEGINIATGKPVTIQVTSPGVSTYRVFNFNATGKTFTLNDLILRGGDVSGLTSPGYYGGVIYISSGTLALNRCVVKEGKAYAGGGIMANFTPYLLLDGCTVNNNTATSGGGGCYVSSTNATILNSTITGNTSLTTGGGIYHRNFNTSSIILQIINTTISGNSAANGGGIYTLGGSSSHTTRCYFLNDIVINNTATSNPDIGKTTYESYIYPYYLWSSYTTATVKTPYATGNLGALADNGGPTPTMALSASAPAYQTGTYAYYNATDGYYYYNGTAYVKLLAGTPTYNVADKILTDQRGATRAATPSMGAYDGTVSSPMQLVFTTTAASQQVAIPLKGTVDVIINWGDGTDNDTITTAGNATHTYVTAGTDTVSITGTLTGLGTDATLAGYQSYLTTVLSWGGIGITDLSHAFYSCGNLIDVPDDIPAAADTLEGMFKLATSFDKNLGGWDVTNITDMTEMFSGVTLSTANYDSLLIGWAAQTVQPNVVFSAGNSQYSAGAAATARGVLTGGTNLWTITDGGQAPVFSGGTGTQADPYQIETLDDLEFLSENSTFWATGKYFIQTADINADDTRNWNVSGSDTLGFSPIGNNTNNFQGFYDGDGFTIDSLFINRPTQDYVAPMFVI